MHRIFLGTAVWVMVLFFAQFGLGFALGAAEPGPARQSLFLWHMMVGIFLATVTLILHVMTMFHFIGSGKELKEAVELLGGDAEVIRRLRRFKMQTSGIATLAPVVTGAAVILGGGAHTGALPSWIHWGLGLAALVVNLCAFPVEYRTLKENLRLIHEIDARMKRELTPEILRRESAS